MISRLNAGHDEDEKLVTRPNREANGTSKDVRKKRERKREKMRRKTERGDLAESVVKRRK